MIDHVLTIPKSISETASFANLTSLTTALSQVQLVDTVNNLQHATVFAPTNTAFDMVNSHSPDLGSDQLAHILKYHVAPQVKYSTDLLNDGNVRNLDDEDIQITSDENGVKADAATVIIPDVLVSNGVVHVIDELVLIPGLPYLHLL